MRGNGLTAEDYAPLAELARSATADALLALRDAGVAAYALQPEDAQDGPVQLYADRTALTRARAVLRDLSLDVVAAPEPPDVDEVAWQQIVSGFSATADEPDHGSPRATDTARPSRRAADQPPADRHPLVSRDDDHFVPDPPPPPPRLDRVSRFAWAGVFGGPLFLLLAAMFSWSPPSAISLVCVLGFVGGMVVLVLRMKDRPPHDSGPDDGAVV